MPTIGELLYIRADVAAHDDYWHLVSRAVTDYLDHRPRIDTREDLHYLAGEVDALHATCSFEAGRRLRKITVDYEKPNLPMTIEPIVVPPELTPATYGTEGDQDARDTPHP